MSYSKVFREKMVRKLLEPGALSVSELSRQVDVSDTTLSRWLRSAQKEGGRMSEDKKKSSKSRRPEDWPGEEKLAAVLEAVSLSGEEMGGFLRRRGLHQADLERWRGEMVRVLDGRPPRSKISSQGRRIRELEKELRRKDKALAETSALLVLQKKVQALWGDGDDVT